MVHATYLSPEGRAAVNAHAAILKAKREATRTERQRRIDFEDLRSVFRGLGWTDEAAQELADIHSRRPA